MHLWPAAVCGFSELLDVELNEQLNTTVNNTQMPKVEYSKISIEDYCEYLSKLSESVFTKLVIYCNSPIICTGLNMQILKPAGLIETAHYPLLLLV